MRLILHLERATFSAEAAPGELLTQALARVGKPLDQSCGGLGLCRRCSVFLVEGELKSLDGERISPDPERSLLGCRHRVTTRDVVLRVPALSRAPGDGQVLNDFVLPDFPFSPTVRVRQSGSEWRVESLQHGVWSVSIRSLSRPQALIGLAVDIGTTTVVATLLDLETGKPLARAGRYNQQIQRAADVASRIALCADPRQVVAQRKLLVEDTIRALIGEVCADAGIARNRISRAALAGNTVMMHLFAGLSPLSMGVAPFTPVALTYPPRLASEYGLEISSRATADLLPSAAAYIGADVVADLLACRLVEGADPALLIDIGTNGEIILLNRGRMVGCATAAGPAFEGAGLACGCRAVRGAVDHLAISASGELEATIIQGGDPVGLCGTAIVDFLADGRRVGWLNEMGRMDLDRLKQAGRHMVVRSGAHPIHACRLADRPPAAAGGIYLSEADVEQSLKAKAAIQAGIATLLDRCALKSADLRRVVVAGGFGRYLVLRNAIAIGLLPDVPVERVEWLGNGSLAGACLALLDQAALPEMHRLAAQISIVELNREKTFETHFIESLMLQ